MPGTGGFRKMRWADARRGKGRRGGLNFGKMGTRPCEAESSGSGSRSSCPQIPRYFRALGRSCGALSAVCVSQGEFDWSFHGSGLAANQTAATSAHQLQNLIRR